MPVDGPHTNAQPEVTVEDAELDQAIADLLTDIRTATPEHTSELGRRLADLLDLRKSLAERRIAEMSDLASRTDRAVHVLDDAASSADLMRRACEQIAELCSARKVVLSRFEQNRIAPLVAFSANTDTSPALPPAFGLVPGSPEARALATNTVSSGDVVSEKIQEALGTNGFSTVPIVVDGARRHSCTSIRCWMVHDVMP